MFWFFKDRSQRDDPARTDNSNRQGNRWSVPGDFATIQEAITAAKNGDTVVVDPGRYLENINFNGKSIRLHSTDPADRSIVSKTVIDGAGKGCVVVFESGECRNTVLEGFTLMNGYAPLGGEHTGGGITIVNQSAPVIQRNVICDNVSELDGGGIFVDDSWPVIRRNHIHSNRAVGAGGGIHIGRDFVPREEVQVPVPAQDAYARFLDSGALTAPRIGMESGEGPGPAELAVSQVGVVPERERAEKPRAIIEANTLAENQAFSGGGIHVADDAPVIEANAFRANEAERGGGMTCWDNSRPVVGKNHLTENVARLGGGGIMVEWGASPAIVGNRFADNVSPEGVDVSVAPNASPIIKANRFHSRGRAEALFLWQDGHAQVESNQFAPFS